jgi:hypothetical protein
VVSLVPLTYTLPEVAQALLAVKTMGKSPPGSHVIATQSNLSTLLAIAKHFKGNTAASSEALKCIANALLLIERARVTWVQDVVDSGLACLEMLQVSGLLVIILEGL